MATYDPGFGKGDARDYARMTPGTQTARSTQTVNAANIATMKPPATTYPSPAPTAGGAAPAQSATAQAPGIDPFFRSQQQYLVDYYKRVMAGEEPSVAQQQLMQGLQRAQASGRSMAASQTGIAPGAAMRMQSQTATALANHYLQQSSQLRAQEQATAAQGLSTIAGQGRQQDTTDLLGLGYLDIAQKQQKIDEYLGKGQLANDQARVEIARRELQFALDNSDWNKAMQLTAIIANLAGTAIAAAAG